MQTRGGQEDMHLQSTAMAPRELPLTAGWTRRRHSLSALYADNEPEAGVGVKRAWYPDTSALRRLDGLRSQVLFTRADSRLGSRQLQRACEVYTRAMSRALCVLAPPSGCGGEPCVVLLRVRAADALSSCRRVPCRSRCRYVSCCELPMFLLWKQSRFRDASMARLCSLPSGERLGPLEWLR